jgi:hypothetical protein
LHIFDSAMHCWDKWNAKWHFLLVFFFFYMVLCVLTEPISLPSSGVLCLPESL